MKPCFKTLMVVVFMLMCSNQLLAFEKLPDAELATLYGGACPDRDCVSGTQTCPTESPDCKLAAYGSVCSICSDGSTEENCGPFQQTWGIMCSYDPAYYCNTNAQPGVCWGPCTTAPDQTGNPPCGGWLHRCSW